MTDRAIFLSLHDTIPNKRIISGLPKKKEKKNVDNKKKLTIFAFSPIAKKQTKLEKFFLKNKRRKKLDRKNFPTIEIKCFVFEK